MIFLINKIFAHRSVISFLVVMALLLSCVLRVAVISASDYSDKLDKQHQHRIEISRLRGTIYDCNMVPLTNSTSKIVAAVLPTQKGINALRSAASKNALDTALKDLKNNIPAICEAEKAIDGEGIATATVFDHTPESATACHIIGYCDNSGHGVSGIELAYDDFLYSEQKLTAVFAVNGKGEVLKGVEPYFENDLSVVTGGVVTTLDINVQKIADKAAAELKSGCVVVAENATGKIRALSSVPSFEYQNIVESLANPKSPLINRALLPFSVGSIFKPCVAAALIASDKENITHYCDGKLKIVDRVFRCHELSGHGKTDLRYALAQSCNCYFYSAAINLGGEKIRNTATSFSIGTRLRLGENIYALGGTLPQNKDLQSEGALANIGIGQGALTASPVAMLPLYMAIARDGSYYLPSIIEKTIKNGVVSKYDYGNPTRAMSEETAKKLRSFLQTVISDGTGIEASPTQITAAGKTATAQTGRFDENGVEITNSWFCGFFPADKPLYTVIIMNEGEIKVSTASIFAQIADEIAQLYGINGENND